MRAEKRMTEVALHGDYVHHLELATGENTPFLTRYPYNETERPKRPPRSITVLATDHRREDFGGYRRREWVVSSESATEEELIDNLYAAIKRRM